MQLDHWQLAELPFQTVVDVNRFYPSIVLEEAIARLEYLVDARRRMGVLLGEGGIGKSLVLQIAARRLTRRGCAVVVVSATGIGTREFLWQVAAGLGAAPRESADVLQLWRLVADRVAENRLQQTNAVLLVDDAGQAGPDLLTQFMRLTRIDSSPAARWTMVLAAEPATAARWNETLRELTELRIDLAPWDETDTTGYVQTSLVEAGRFDPVFDKEGLRAIYELTGGVPRRVMRLADLSLIAGTAAGVISVGDSLVREVHREMSWPTATLAY